MTKLSRIYGLRLVCPASLEVVADDAPIFVHGSLEERCSDFEFLFAGLFDRWRDCYVVNSFFSYYLADASLEEQ